MSGESFLSSALRLFSVSDPTDSETAAISGEAGSSIEKPHGQGIANAGGDAVQSEANEAATSSEPAHLSIRASASVRGSVRAGEKFWEDEAATPRLSAPSAAGTPTLVSTPGTSATDAVAVLPPGMVSARRLAEFTRCLEAKSVNSESLRRLAWFGVPSRYRTAVWQILLGYLPASADRVQDSLARKRAEYEGFVAAVSGRGGLAKGEGEQRMLRQVLVDCPRTCPGIPLFHSAWVQRSLAKVLTVYATRHFATGYVQGINDLACPFYAVFLSPWADLDSGDDVLATIPAQDLAEVEADVYWCLTRTLEGIQSHYLASQPGLHSMMAGLRDLCFRIDERLVVHLEKNDVEFKTFSFRWMNCLLMRELPVRLVIRLWDTYIAESTHAVKDGFEAFHVYVCAALLDKFKAKLLSLHTHELLSFLQALDKETSGWGVTDIEELLSKAYIYTQMFPGAATPLRS